MSQIVIHDKTFIPLIKNEEIQKAVSKIALTINEQYKNETPIFVGVLSGVFMFFSDFLKNYPGKCEVSFLKLSSYDGTQSTGNVTTELDISTDITNRHVIILEDIVDTGNTLEKLYQLLKNKPVKSLKVASLFLKPDVFKKDFQIDYVGICIPNKFVVGYGLDYNGLGRNYTNLYQLKED
ncbi:MAG: hypoxanthine phosphoribosyltransferase [Flavobacteriales bacterium]|nr:hypoxanthine phosphoribosyltransferase [Flavobacteriales bacterium]